jgi:hypothetical protein
MNEHDDMELKRAMDGLPRSIEPPGDLWPGVRGRLEARTTADRKTGKPSRFGLRSPVSGLRVAALLTLLAISAAALALTRHGAATWRVASGAGAERVMHAGDALEGSERSRIAVGRIGTMDVAPGTSLRVLKTGITDQRVAVARGTIHASISAPPRVFVVETPSGTAVDLGCEYTLEVQPSGTRLEVTAGWVEFTYRNVRSLVPAGMTAFSAREGIGLPIRDAAPPALDSAVRAFDRQPSDSAVSSILRLVERRDAVTLWHLVDRTSGAARERVVTKLISLAPLPDGVERERIVQRDPHAMELYWTALPGTLPIIPSWQQALWKLWLKVGG